MSTSNSLSNPGELVSTGGPNCLDSVAKSYVLANSITSEPFYNPDAARALLVTFPESVLDTAVRALLKTKILKPENKGRPTPGRSYTITEQFQAAFKRATYDVDGFFRGAVNYKQRLDEAFERHGYLDFEYHAGDPHVMVVMNLYAAGRVRIRPVLPPVTTDSTVPSRDPVTGQRHLSVWGFTEGNYKSKSLDKDNFNFPLRVTPNESYVEGVPLPDPLPAPPAPHLEQPQEPPATRRIPLWYDIHGRLVPQMWEALVGVILTTTALRPGSSEKEIVAILKGNVELWDVELAVQWLLDVGVIARVRRCDSKSIGHWNGGLAAQEWWWGVFGGSRDVDGNGFEGVADTDANVIGEDMDMDGEELADEDMAGDDLDDEEMDDAEMDDALLADAAMDVDEDPEEDDRDRALEE